MTKPQMSLFHLKGDYSVSKLYINYMDKKLEELSIH